MMRGVAGVRKSIQQSLLAKCLGLGLLCLTKMGIKTVPQPPYNPDLAPCDFPLFPKLRGCRYEKIEEMKEAATKIIDTLTQEGFHGGTPEVVGMVQQVHCIRRRLLRRGQ